MMTTTRILHDMARGLSRPGAVAAAMLLALAGCKSNPEFRGLGVSGGKRPDPFLAGPGNLLPKQNVPIPDRMTGPTNRPDPLVAPTGSGKHAGYNADPERFQGTVILNPANTPAALAGRLRDGDELKIDDTTDGVPLRPVGGVLATESRDTTADLEPLYAQLSKLGVQPSDRILEREGTQWVFRASLVTSATGAKTQYTGVGRTAREAIENVLVQLPSR
ncbi:MAG: hypothetical protein RMJ56_11845 [Gemmataceae bacterium]|nr:hypothetical protein [Gemmata sp.]MDW8198284.1 hypothetical protein [Gemmataceae bacterium]